MIILDLKAVELPNVNDRYKKGFYLSETYKIRKESLREHIEYNCKGMKKIKPPYSVNIMVGTHYDIDNFLKPLFDAMQKSGVIDNDKNIEKLTVEKATLGRNQQNWITVTLIGEI